MTDADRPTPEQVEALRPTLARIIESVLRPDELDGWDVGWVSEEVPRPLLGVVEEDGGPGWWAASVLRLDLDGPSTPAPAPQQDELWVIVRARGEEFRCPVWVPDGWAWGGDLANVVDGIEDFVSESRFAWGQQRIAWRPPPGR